MTDKNKTMSTGSVEKSVAEGGSYELIYQRLQQQAGDLEQAVANLNQRRTQEFGKSDFNLLGRARIRTEHNCIPRDIVRVGDWLLFGFNVFMGLKKKVLVSDVFSLHRLVEQSDSFDFENLPLEHTFLDDPLFVKDFTELYEYYKQTRLIQLRVVNSKVLAAFQIGEKYTDVRVFRWALEANGDVKYIDNRGERDFVFPRTHDFEWTRTTREQQVLGAHPHFNIADKVFVETVGGNLTFKIENNTSDGEGIYNELVEDKYQTLEDAEIYYADLGSLLLFKIRPFREQAFRYFVFNYVLKTVVRIDQLATSCVQLPEEHGIIYPGGYYLTNGTHKQFDQGYADVVFKRMCKSPNGKDVLYIFYQPELGLFILMAYDLIEKSMQTPLETHGVGLYEDGRILVFKAENEPTRVHPVQVWQTPFCSDEFNARLPVANTPLAKIGNTELVKGIAELFGLCRDIQGVKPTSTLYEQLIKRCQSINDNFFWLAQPEMGQMDVAVKGISQTAELVLDEFEKVIAIERKAQQALLAAQDSVKQVINSIFVDSWHDPVEFVNALDRLRKQKGHLISIKEVRYIDLAQVALLEQSVVQWQDKVSQATVRFLQQDKALEAYDKKLLALSERINQMDKVVALQPVLEELSALSDGLNLLTEMIAGLNVDDATIRARLLENVTEVFSRVNQQKATATHKAKSLRSTEAVAEFAAQFKLLEQSISNGLSSASTPNACDELLARLLLQIEELETRFNEFESFMADIASKREEIYEAFESHKQQLIEQRQRRAQTIADAAKRILEGIPKRVQRFSVLDDLNTYLASDAMLMKLSDMVLQLRQLEDSVRADDIEAKFKAAKEQAIRSLRDKQDIFDEGGQVIKLGKHRFSVNTQALDLTIVAKDEQLQFHLSGTDYWQKVTDPSLLDLAHFWQQPLSSESADVYRAEYLSYAMLQAAERHEQGLTWSDLKQALLNDETLLQCVRTFMGPRYQEGYVKGIHDHDTVKILKALLPIREGAGLLYFPASVRALGLLFFAYAWSREQQLFWQKRAQSALKLHQFFADSEAIDSLSHVLKDEIAHFFAQHQWSLPAKIELLQVAQYLVRAIVDENLNFSLSRHGDELYQLFIKQLDKLDQRRHFTDTLQALETQIGAQWDLVQAWVLAFIRHQACHHLQPYWPEVALRLMAQEAFSYSVSQLPLQVEVTGLLGEHSRLSQQCLLLSLDDFTQRLSYHHHTVIPQYQRFLQLRQQVLQREKQALRLEEYQANPLTTFVRNKLINDVYLPIIGDNLAKQMGTMGENRRTDLMGLLLLISPPGYGKTTLMEYVANRLGLIFMKINCPSIGHEVTSLDSDKAPNSTAKQELIKLNLALEMSNNVMLYLDDIQHTHPEFLQKFISLCDGTRKIEGTWQGRSKTYDMRGKKFCVVMAGNPYTESGEVFKIPDMLANRADIYNLGDVLSGKESVFEMSYLENCLSSNPVLAPLATRSMQDVYKLIAMAQGQNIAATELEYDYSAAELNEITTVLRHLISIQSVVLKVNQQYIASAGQADAYRTEPPFKLQGSYRNMSKMAGKIAAVMNQDEIKRLIDDHYVGEAQTLTLGAEENLLKLAELRGTLSSEQQQRWLAIKKEFVRRQTLGGDDDVGAKIVNQLSQLSMHVADMVDGLRQTSPVSAHIDSVAHSIEKVQQQLAGMSMQVEVVNQPVPGMDRVLRGLTDTVENSILPVVSAMEHKIRMDHDVWNKVKETANTLKALESELQRLNLTHTQVISPDKS